MSELHRHTPAWLWRKGLSIFPLSRYLRSPLSQCCHGSGLEGLGHTHTTGHVEKGRRGTALKVCCGIPRLRAEPQQWGLCPHGDGVPHYHVEGLGPSCFSLLFRWLRIWGAGCPSLAPFLPLASYHKHPEAGWCVVCTPGAPSSMLLQSVQPCAPWPPSSALGHQRLTDTKYFVVWRW
jgi:hypothetical protein